MTIYGRSNSIGSKHLLGRINLGEQCISEQGKHHWNEMKNNEDSTVNQWHQLT